jgi:serine/threonine protein kinase
MSDTGDTASWSLPPSEARRVDQLCNDFEAAWKEGLHPDLAAYLARASGPERPALLAELLQVEIAYRRKRSEEPRPAEYLVRFAELYDVVAAVFRQATTAGPADQLTVLPPDAPALPRPSPPAPAERPALAGYEILEAFPAGGMGIVYKARQVSLNRLVAVKCIRHEFLAREQERTRFRIEAAAIARLRHPHIVQVHDYGEQTGMPYFVMEYVEGGTLAQGLSRRKPSFADAARLVEALAGAMQYAHEQHVIHRDLKPGNVLLAADGTPKIADFGLAKCLDEDRQLTDSQTVLGTVSYMSPEQAAGKSNEVGPTADVYALGAILYELLTGCPPFLAETRELTRVQVLSEEAVPPRRRRAEVPGDLEMICLKCLEKDPVRRYPSARTLADDLGRFQAGEPISLRKESFSERQTRAARRAGYEVLDTIGQGPVSVVYRARQVSLGRIVALKMIRAENFPTETDLERFRQEATVVGGLQHPNIVQVYDCGERDGQPYYSMEFLEGGTLAQKLGGKLFSAEEAARLLEVLARAAAYAHGRGVLHRDLKPANVLFGADGTPKITDFGVAKQLGAESTGMTLTGMVVGTPTYMAPEQLQGMPNLGPATDIFSLGVILYELLGGRPPFRGKSAVELYVAILQSQPEPLSAASHFVPPDLDAICLHCLQKEPAKRYAGASDLADDLRAFLAGEPIGLGGLDPWQRLARWAGYHVVGPLGRGGLGEVYRATHTKFGRAVALKIVRSASPEQIAQIRARFHRAAERMAGLRHPNIVQVYEAGEWDAIPFLAVELVEGPDLARRSANRPQPVGETVRLVETLARALHRVHEAGLVHRNLKPANVLFTADGTPKITDFELARDLRQPPSDQEQAGEVIGTPRYMAPEQAAGRNQEIGPATDVYALGVILYEQLTGKWLVEGANVMEILQAVRSQAPVRPSLLRCDLPPALEAICLRCLDKDPRNRFASAAELADALAAYLVAHPETPEGEGLFARLRRWWSG